MKTFIISSESDRLRAMSFIDSMGIEKPMHLVLKQYKANRSLAANGLYRIWLGEISKETGQDEDSLHEHFKDEYIETEYITVFGKTKTKTKTTTKLNTKEFTIYLNKIEHWCLHFLNMTLSHPEDLYFSAMYGAKKKS